MVCQCSQAALVADSYVFLAVTGALNSYLLLLCKAKSTITVNDNKYLDEFETNLKPNLVAMNGQFTWNLTIL